MQIKDAGAVEPNNLKETPNINQKKSGEERMRNYLMIKSK